MKTKQNCIKLLSMLLCCVMLVGMIPAIDAKAAESINTISVTTIPLLDNTKLADLFAATGVTYDETKMTLYEVQIKQEDTLLSSLTNANTTVKFDEGTNYQIFLIFDARENYRFDVTSATVNGAMAMINTQNGSTISIKTNYTVPEAAKLENVDVLVTPPKSGEAPNYTATVAESQKDLISVDGDVYWGYGETGSIPVISNEGVFVKEREYTVRVKLIPAAGYKLSEQTVCTINGNPATINLEYNSISYKFPPLETEMLQEVSATCNLTTGTKLSEYDFGIPAEAGYEATNITWYQISSDSLGESATQISSSYWDSTTIDATKDYKVDFTLKAKTGYEYKNDTTFTIHVPDNAIVTLGTETTVKEKKVSIKFGKAVVGKTNITISPITVGQRPDTVTIESDNENCIVKTVTWTRKGGNMTETFEAGETYAVNINLIPADRYLLWDVRHTCDLDEVSQRITVNHAPMDKDFIGYNFVTSALNYWIELQPHSHEYATQWSKDETSHYHVCDCGDKKDVAAHTFNEGTVTKEPTCKEDGVKTYTCSVCGQTRTEAIAKHENHTFDTGTVTTPATETTTGVKTYTCTVCGKTKTESIPKTDKKEETQGTEKVAVSGISISGISKKLAAGKKVQLTATITPVNATNQTVIWKSSNTKYATVSNTGKVSLKKAGAGKTVTITATAADGSGITATYKIQIMKDAVKKVKITAPAKTVKAGKSLKLKATVTTTGKKANKKLQWKSSNTTYATVSKSGKVTAKKAGKGKTVTITASATDGSGKKAKVKIKIK